MENNMILLSSVSVQHPAMLFFYTLDSGFLLVKNGSTWLRQGTIQSNDLILNKQEWRWYFARCREVIAQSVDGG